MKTKGKFCCLTAFASLLISSVPISGQLPPQSAPANSTIITRVEVVRIDDQTTVRISGDHPLILHTEHLTNPERVVLDFTNAHLGLGQTSAPSVLKPVSGIRVGQFQPNVARVVVDLEASAPYKINAEGQTITVAFAAVSTAPAENPPAAALPKRENATPGARRMKSVLAPATSNSETQPDTDVAGNVALPSQETNSMPTISQNDLSTLQRYDQPPRSSSTSETQSDSLLPPVITSLETGQVLTDGSGTVSTTDGNGRVSPVYAGRVGALWHLGHLSLLSLSTFYEYDSNFGFSSTPQSMNALAVQGLLHYSIGNERTALDLQYRPYVLVSQETVYANLIANSIDIHTFHFINARWLLNFDDRFQYQPARGRVIDPTISADFSSGIISRGLFIATDTATLSNALSIGVSDHFNGHDTLTFHGQYQYVVEWSAPSSTMPMKLPTPMPTALQQENMVGGGISWSHQVSERQRFGVSYNYDRQVLGGVTSQSQYHSVLVDYTQMIRPSLLIQVSFGPSWQVQGINSRIMSTSIGTASILKTFHVSNIVLSYSRNDDYSGVIANGYYNRYEGSYTRSLGRRLEFSAGAGYLQQGFNTLPNLDGREEWGRLSYALSEKLSAFLSVSNFAAQGGTQPYASRNLFSAGLRWGYQRQEQTEP